MEVLALDTSSQLTMLGREEWIASPAESRFLEGVESIINLDSVQMPNGNRCNMSEILMNQANTHYVHVCKEGVILVLMFFTF